MDGSYSGLAAPHVRNALDGLRDQGRRMRDSLRFDWPAALDQAVHWLRYEIETQGRPPCMVALVGGASSGKSTVFNNLLGGRPASRITAWGHATLGLLLAAHEENRPRVEGLLSGQALFPGLKHRYVEIDQNVTGEPDAVTVLFHTCEPLRDVMLFDTPDFTSQMSKAEGEVLLTQLPWFDRLIVVLDQERWFDRQSVSRLRAESARWGQDRFALFNRTAEGIPAESHQELLRQQAERLGASGMSILEFRRGRGLRLFPPQAFAELLDFARAGTPKREEALLRQLGVAANRVLNLNQERRERLMELKAALQDAVERCVPSVHECMTGLMTPAERKLLEPVSRILGIQSTRQWLVRRARRWRDSLRRVPLGSILGAEGTESDPSEAAETVSRRSTAAAYFETFAARGAYEIQRTVQGCLFWAEIRNWTDLKPSSVLFQWSDARRKEVMESADAFDRALLGWNTKVQEECRGLTPHVQGAVGVSILALAVVLIAVPGPVAALSLVAVKGAVGGALAPLAAAGGFGALFGKHLGRLASVVRERLVGSPELSAVLSSAEAFRRLLAAAVRELNVRALDECTGLVLPEHDFLTAALEAVRKVGNEGR